MEKFDNDTSKGNHAERLLSDGELDMVTGGIIIIGGAESRFCSNNLTTAVLTDQYSRVV